MPLSANRVLDTDTAGDLLDRLSVAGADLMVQTLDGIEDGTLDPQPQPESQTGYAAKITVEDAKIDWTAPADVIDRLIRGTFPAPGAWTTFGGERFKINSAERAAHHLAPGALEISKHAVDVGTGTRALRLGEVQPPGKRPMPAADWARGVAFGPDPALGS